ncbi:methylmalonyl Co-A mutase-associated GTPase MeaB [Geothermobacter hydrogeniphilus]|uniref:Methylmalonyl Co-A mutase-associated GTPase MeaB n=1 Tax=Geothermobacter hydrogeniphilus TaxID=1969733 RepID=A0A1X0YA47_9BACT|nr:methylmalonyl Co-A mutase-associated GTPase MeaB [Geothermobacter hydrogeniphilus]ORJ62055.1 methylmalonyl Co-A mutase-associated GTPase MeaB [Geothermobacter hydrogeniphilus]
MPKIKELAAGVRTGNIRSLAKAITLVESRSPDHSLAATTLLDELLPDSGNSIRVGISGVPGVGKSTFIEALGLYLTGRGHKVAVLAVDPSSQLSGGSILGDKTRMEELSRDPNAFIRPSPSGDTLGGVARKTRETMLICEAAGYDVVIVETVGVGQSEITVASMVDLFLLLQIPGAGDELQGIKKGVMEIADLILINKAEGDNRSRAALAKSQIETALHILQPKSPNWTVPVMLCSALRNEGIAEVWQTIEDYRSRLQESGEFADKRRLQAGDWMWSLLMDSLRDLFRRDPRVEALLPQVQDAVAAGTTTPGAAARRLLEAFKRH